MKMTFTSEEAAALTASCASFGELASHEKARFDRHFRFVDENGVPIVGIRVHLTAADGGTNPVTTDGDGRTPVMAGSEGQRIGVSLSKGSGQ